MPAFTLFGRLWLAIAPLAAMETTPAISMLDQLVIEAAALRMGQPDQWRQHETNAGEVFAENQRRTAGWKKRSSPPRPDLVPLKLPLAFLVDRLLSKPPPVVGESGTNPQESRLSALRHEAYFTAIIHSDDERRIAALREYREREQALPRATRVSRRWNSIFAEAATLEWAVAQIEVIAPQGKASAPIDDDLVYCLGKRFGDELPKQARAAAYEYLRSFSPSEPRTYPYRPWDALFRLDAARARRELLPYFYKTGKRADESQAKSFIPAYNLGVIQLLRTHAGESPEVAAAVRQWLASPDLMDHDRPVMHGILLRADPIHELGPAVQRIDALLVEQERTGKRFEFGGEIHVLLGETTQIKSPAADREVARYVRETGIDPLARLSLLESLVRNRYANSAGVIAHWLREESAPWPDALRRSAERWDEFGQKALQQAERIDFMDARQAFHS